MYTRHGGFNADVVMSSDKLQMIKTTKVQFPDLHTARDYLADCEDYYARLENENVHVAKIHDQYVMDDLRIRQVWNAVEGLSLQDVPTPRLIADVCDMLLHLSRDHDGKTATLPDFSLSNFIVDTATHSHDLTLIDTLPPLTKRAGEFPYERMRFGQSSRIARHWYDEYWRTPDGAVTRTVAMGARAIGRAADLNMRTSFDVVLEALDAPIRSRTMRLMPGFMASTAAFRAVRLPDEIVRRH